MAQVEAKTLSRLAWPAYAVAFLFCFTPMFEWAAALSWRFDFGTLAWRTGAIGLLASSLITPIFALFLATLVSYLLGHRITLRIVAVLSALATVGLLAILGVFVLDAIQLRATVTEVMQRSFMLAAMKAIVNLVTAAIVLAIISVSGLLAARQAAKVRAASSSRTAQEPLLVSSR